MWRPVETFADLKRVVGEGKFTIRYPSEGYDGWVLPWHVGTHETLDDWLACGSIDTWLEPGKGVEAKLLRGTEVIPAVDIRRQRAVHVDAPLSLIERVGKHEVVQLGRFELTAGDVLWLQVDEGIGEFHLEQTLNAISELVPAGVQLLAVRGARPVAVHRAAITDRPEPEHG